MYCTHLSRICSSALISPDALPENSTPCKELCDIPYTSLDSLECPYWAHGDVAGSHVLRQGCQFSSQMGSNAAVCSFDRILLSAFKKKNSVDKFAFRDIARVKLLPLLQILPAFQRQLRRFWISARKKKGVCIDFCLATLVSDLHLSSWNYELRGLSRCFDLFYFWLELILVRRWF